MIKNLDELAKEYSQNKNKIILNKLFKAIKTLLDKKANFIYYKKLFKYKNYTFTLHQIKEIELTDIKQDLSLEVLKLLNRYDSNQSFEKYLISSLWNYAPSFINKKFCAFIENKSNSTIDADGNEINPVDAICHIDKENEIETIDLFENLTDLEKKLINFMLEFPDLTQSEIAKKLEVTQQRVSQLLFELRKKYTE